MQKTDLDQVMAIEQASFGMPWSRNLFLSEFRSPGVSTLLVAREAAPSARTIRGYVIFWYVENEMHILNLAVASEYRRQGIARELVLAALKRAFYKGARRAFLEARASNTAAQKLYQDLGFTGSFIRRDYYEAPVEDAVVMTLEQGVFENIVKSL
jgi:ribosomal-protein-alanine N-acetyltransferase